MDKDIHITIRIPSILYSRIKLDLERRHDHALERVGFAFSRMQLLDKNQYLIIINDYDPVQDEDYVEDSNVCAHISSDAIVSALQKVIDTNSGGFHVHCHNTSGIPNFSPTDLSGLPRIPQCFKVNSNESHGLLLLNKDQLNCLVWLPSIDTPVLADKIVVVGYPMRFSYPKLKVTDFPEKYNRQSFLGDYSHFLFENTKIGIVGFGGGGSHVNQQLGHLGIGNYAGFDDDIVEDTNLNRLVGAGVDDVLQEAPKVEVASRLLQALLPGAEIDFIKGRWERKPEVLHSCDIVVGCVDSIVGRRDLEAECRRYLIPFIDIGMDVSAPLNEPPQIRGQIILSMPGDLCMHCYEFITEDALATEVGRYGVAGSRPQVVWSNGVLASTAVGVAVDLITGWTKLKDRKVYLSYNGNTNLLLPHTREKHPINETCPHYPLFETGPPQWKKLSMKKTPTTLNED